MDWKTLRHRQGILAQEDRGSRTGGYNKDSCCIPYYNRASNMVPTRGDTDKASSCNYNKA